jgi:hypothetical protein
MYCGAAPGCGLKIAHSLQAKPPRTLHVNPPWPMMAVFELTAGAVAK